MVVGTLMNICDDPTRRVSLPCCMLLFSTCMITVALNRHHLQSCFPNCLVSMAFPQLQNAICQLHCVKELLQSCCCLSGGQISPVGHAMCQHFVCRVSIAQEWRDNDRVERVPIIVTGNDLSRIFAPFVRDGRMVRFDLCAAAAALHHFAAAVDEPAKCGRPAATYTAEAGWPTQQWVHCK